MQSFTRPLSANPRSPMPEAPRIVIFCHSLISDWNHGNAHFLRGVARDMIARGFDLRVYEPADSWSAANLVADHGPAALNAWRSAYPGLDSVRYDAESLDLDQALDGAALVLVHEWNDPALVGRIGAHRRLRGRYLLLFHDTHHRAVSDPEAIRAFDLGAYDGVLAFGEVLRDAYLRLGWARRAFTWHEAADIALFRPPPARDPLRDLVWVGNWGDDERRPAHPRSSGWSTACATRRPPAPLWRQPASNLAVIFQTTLSQRFLPRRG